MSPLAIQEVNFIHFIYLLRLYSTSTEAPGPIQSVYRCYVCLKSCRKDKCSMTRPRQPRVLNH